MYKYYQVLIVLFVFYWSCTNHNNVNPGSHSTVHPSIIENNQLKILSWNIKMLPKPYGWFHKPNHRAENIIQILIEMDLYDVIFFQEAFSCSIRNKIYDALKMIYPYQIEPNNNNTFYKSNSGLWAISSIPITLIKDMTFTQLRSSDRLVSKGAKLYSVLKNQQKFHLINTHMQADYNTKYCDIRISQYMEIKDILILPNEKIEVPMILCGDLNINKPIKLKQMLLNLNLIDGPLLGKLQHSTLGKNKELLDYILVHSKNAKFQSVKRRIIDLSQKIKGEKFPFSDHHPIEAVITW